jgi:hypothetical protein
MQSLSGRSLVWIGALLLLAPGAVRADFYTNWSYSWSFDPIGKNAPGHVPATSGTGAALFAAQSGNSGAPTIPVALVSTTSSATTTPDSFQNAIFTFNLTITDNATHASGTFSIAGSLTGDLGDHTSGVVATFDIYPRPASDMPIGDYGYFVYLPDRFMTLPAPGEAPKLLNATVLVEPNDPSAGGSGPPLQNAPEPSGFALAGVAAITFALARRRPAQQRS